MRGLLLLCVTFGSLFLFSSQSKADDPAEAERVAAKAVRALNGAVVMQGEFVTSVDFRNGRRLTDEQLKQLIQEFKKFRKLQSLSFVGCGRLTDEGLTALLKEHKSWRHLRVLLIGSTKATDATLKEVKHLQGLQRLGLTNNVSDAGLRELYGMKELRRLVVLSTQTTEKGINDLKKDLPRLEVISTMTPAAFQIMVEEVPTQPFRVSPHETTRSTIDGNEMTITYGRPSLEYKLTGEIRGVWGHMVPYGEPWRTGADEATAFRTQTPIVMGGTTIPAGSYTLYTLPMKDGLSKLVISTRTGQYGVPIDRDHDLVQIDMKREPLEKSIDPFTMVIEKNKTGGVLKLMWEKTQFSVLFTVKK